MYGHKMLDSLQSQNAILNQKIADYTVDVLEKTDLQVRKNDCFIDYVKSLSDLCLEDS